MWCDLSFQVKLLPIVLRVHAKGLACLAPAYINSTQRHHYPRNHHQKPSPT
jgi:hypothetical protein